MVEEGKVSDFFAKLDRSKKREGFNTMNEIAQKTQKRIDASLLRHRRKDEKIDQIDDDEWKPIDVDTLTTSVLPWDFDICENIVGSLDQLKVSQQVDIPRTEKPKQEEKWKEPPEKVVETKVETIVEIKPVSNGKFKFGVGSRSKSQQKSIPDNEFPDLVDSYIGKKMKKKNHPKGVEVNGGQST